MTPPPQRIVWLYKRWLPLYDEISTTVVPRVEFIRGIPMDLDGDHYFDLRIRNVIVLDDLMSTAAKDPRINDLFTKGSHHCSLSVVTLNQNLFFGKDPTQRRNCDLLPSTLQKSRRPTTHRDARKTDVPQTGPRLFIEIRRSHEGTLLVPVVDLKPTTPDSLRLRTDVLGTGIENEKGEEEEKAEDEEDVEEEEEQKEHPDLLACRPCGLVFAHTWGLKDHQIRRRTSRQEMQERRRWDRRHIRLRTRMLP